MEFKEAHGFLGKKEWEMPKLVTKTTEVNREDQGNMMNASEWLDSDAVIEAKTKAIADLIARSKCCVAYTGAGLSRASGIPDYASKVQGVVRPPTLRSALDAQPTFAHHVLAALQRRGLLKYLVQQNHDGLPQKAGIPQMAINEIHGAWHDPSNPVVKFVLPPPLSCQKGCLFSHDSSLSQGSHRVAFLSPSHHFLNRTHISSAAACAVTCSTGCLRWSRLRTCVSASERASPE